MAEPNPFPIIARGVEVRFGSVVAITGIELALEAEGRTVVLGANGAGKSVLLRVLHGLVAPTAGFVSWGGSTDQPASQAMVFQRPVMLRRSALENVAYGLAVRGFAREERRRRAREAIERVGLSHLSQRQGRVLSAGEQQRLALARAWALHPRVLFLDEPTASLDPAAAAAVERIVGEIHAGGTAIVMTTHHLGLARRVADEVVFMHQGRIAERTPADAFFQSPRSHEGAAYLAGELP